MNHWTARAACRGMDTELFFSYEPQDVDTAKRTCATCPVRQACHEDALATDPSKAYGVRGGLTGYERQEMRRPRKPQLSKAQRAERKDISRTLIDRGLSSREIAVRLGVDKRTVSRWRNEYRAAA